MRLIDADALLSDRMKTKFYHLPNGDVAIPIIDVEHAPTVGGWISVKGRLPEEHESIFHKLLGTRKWSSAMWQQESDKVLVCVSFPDGTSVVTTGCLHNSDWVTTVSKALPQTVTHWMPLPEPPKEVSKDG